MLVKHDQSRAIGGSRPARSISDKSAWLMTPRPILPIFTAASVATYTQRAVSQWFPLKDEQNKSDLVGSDDENCDLDR